jgi:hypothetical protein
MRFAALLGVGLLAGGVAWGAEGEEPILAPGTVPLARGYSSGHPGKVIDVSVMNASFVAVDETGRLIRDLSREELRIFEDGAPVRLLELEHRKSSDELARGGSPTTGAEDDRASAFEQRVVIYVSAELGGRGLFRTLCRRVGEEAARLTRLGPVDVVVAAPIPTPLTTAEHRPVEVRRALDLAVSRASGVGEVASIRNIFARNLKRGEGLGVSYAAARSSPASLVVRARIAMSRERAVVRGEIERMVAWLQSQPPETDGLLIWMTGGFDLNPADFYIPLVEQIDLYAGRTLRADSLEQSLEHEVRWLAEVAISLGWTVLPVTSSHTRFLFSTDVDGTGMWNRESGDGAVRRASRSADFVQADPDRPLRIVAEATGGLVATNAPELSKAIDHTESVYRLAYQVDRPLDGRMHRVEIRCLRPGVRILCSRQAASGTSRGLATGRALCLLAGKGARGDLDMSATVQNIARAEKGRKIGDLGLTANLGELRPLLRPLALGIIRVTVVVEIQGGAPFVNHQEIDIDWDRMEDVWRFTAGLKWPKRAKRVVVVVEELVSSTWGAAMLDLS